MGLLVTITMGFSIVLTFLSLFYAVINRSWKAMLVCFISSLPISMYFINVNPPLSFIGFSPLLFLTLTVIFRARFQKVIIS